MTHILEVQGYNRRGGSERHTAMLSRRLAERAWRVTVASPPGGLLNDPGTLGRATFLPVSLSGRADFASVTKLARYCLSERVDLVHTHCRNADLLGGIATLLAQARRRRTGPRLVATIHGMLVDADGVVASDCVNRAHRRFLARVPDFLIGISDGVSANARQVLGVPGSRIVTVLNGTEPPSRDQVLKSRRLARSLRHHPNELLLVQAGSLEPSKGADVLIDAVGEIARRGTSARLVLVGDGSLRDDLELRARTAAAGCVTFTGTVPDATFYLGAADVVCLASRWEGFGRTLTEAMSFGIPVAASRTGGIPEIVDHDVSGILVEPGSVADWTRTLGRLAGDAALRRRLGREGRQRFEHAFHAERFVDATERHLRALLEGNRMHAPEALVAVGTS